ncbi:HAD family hydrolase [Metabacillus fastidiosus]|uniref:HAD family hydrolase n=1 Tax=Metabacillus fastidiosus TaxID=1458 RepID=UPI003D2B308C
MKKHYIWFDLGYTLLYQDREQIYKKFLHRKQQEIEFERIVEAYHIADKLFMREYPGMLSKHASIFYPWYLGVVNHYLNLQFDLFEQHEFLQREIQKTEDYWRPFHFTKDTLQYLKTNGYQLGLISNWDNSARGLLDKHELTNYFDHIVISSEVGIEKPDAEIFDLAFQLAGTSAEQNIYVGDNYYDDVLGSAKIGVESVLINRFGKKGIEEINHTYVVESIEQLPELLHDVPLLKL